MAKKSTLKVAMRLRYVRTQPPLSAAQDEPKACTFAIGTQVTGNGHPESAPYDAEYN
jgi:hypothetical protein